MTAKPPDIAAIATDPSALEAFYLEHLDSIRGFVARRVDDPHVAADVTADIFLAAIHSASSFQSGRGSPRAWLIGIARNVIDDHRRAKARELRAVGRIAGPRLLDPESIARIEERIDAEREVRRIYGCLDVLSSTDRALFELIAIDGQSVADAAAVLGVQPGTARVRLHRARRAVKARLRLITEADARSTLEVPT